MFAKKTISIYIHIVGGVDDNKKDSEYPIRGETENTHHVPVNPTETSSDNGVLIMNNDERPTNFFAQPGILAGELKIYAYSSLFFFMNFLSVYLIHSCHRWSRRWIIVRNPCCDVHCVSNEKERRRKLRS
jgi:hypothetical protein